MFSWTVVLADSGERFDTQEFLEERVAIIEPGVLPNSFWYWGDIFAEELRFVFTVGKEQKADYLIEIAKERLAEMKKLSEEGITKYADKLMTDHEEAIQNAEKFYREMREKGIEQAKELQEDTEMEILRTEKKVKYELGDAENKYREGQKGVVARIGAWFSKIKSHLRGKKGQIEEQRTNVFE
jgi:hypothetical protein